MSFFAIAQAAMNSTRSCLSHSDWSVNGLHSGAQEISSHEMVLPARPGDNTLRSVNGFHSVVPDFEAS